MFEKHCPSPHTFFFFFVFWNWILENLNLCCSRCKNHTDSYTPTPKQWKEQFPVNLEGGLPMQDLEGATSGSTSALQTIAPSYTIAADFLLGFQKCALLWKSFKGTKPENHQTKKTPTISISQQSLQIPWGMQCRNGPHYSKHNPPHTPRLIIQSEFAKIRMEKWVAPKQGKATKHNVKNTFPQPFCIRSLQIHQNELEIRISSAGFPFKVLRTF